MPRRRYLRVALPVIAASLALANAQSAEQRFNPQRPVASPAQSLEFKDTNNGVRRAIAWGNIATGPYGAINQLPAHFTAPLHTHTTAYHGMVISGTMINPFNRQPDPPKMGPGSYWFVPAEAIHTTGCASDTPCVFYFHSEGGFDFKPVK